MTTRTILITGASSGIGLASARLFLERGWNVIATMRDPAATGLKPAQRLLTERLDVQDLESIAPAIRRGIDHFGGIDVLFNNAGYGEYGVFEGATRERVRQQFDVNVFGVMDVTREVLPHFRNRRAGTIINTSSGAGTFTLPMSSLYCASKFALEGFSEALAYELAALDIVVKIVIPHGGVASTRFGQRAGADAATYASIPDYLAFENRTHAAFDVLRSLRAMEASDVADMVYVAATDGSRRLRYPIGDDAAGLFKARRTLSEEQYIDFMRSRFPSK